ncbi:hypothetical protein FUAX_53020 (plasmid) [Fulvitalea axinellae]|uniref:Cell surface protein SprA n=1 Tax=Fulvitalea axinellae TaxID=1182444 RepID=A0AAU9DK21_9BACT|nr:hypothetical protein FUAX_53020 [Fulvitalea axinellae]
MYRRSRFFRFLAAFIAVHFLSYETLVPVAYALTSGPTQPEVQGFEPFGTTDMVNLFSGDFTYNIPLFELPGPNGGYPFNLAYHGGITMDQEASWVGLGWSLNPGAINRQMRGLPDEFKGDEVKVTQAMTPSHTMGVNGGGIKKIFGAANLAIGVTIQYNNYKGFGYSLDPSLGVSKSTGFNRIGFGLGAEASISSDDGVNAKLNSSISFDNSLQLKTVKNNASFSGAIGYNNRQGLKDISLQIRAKKRWLPDPGTSKKRGYQERSIRAGAHLSFASPGYTPQISRPMRNFSANIKVNIGASFWGFFGGGYAGGFYTRQGLKDNGKTINYPSYGYLNMGGEGQYQSLDAMLDFNRDRDGIVHEDAVNLAIPSLTYDIFSAVGQGIGGMYRGYRNDRGLIYDPLSTIDSYGGSLGGDFGPTFAHVGGNLSLNMSLGRSHVWEEGNGAFDKFKFKNTEQEYTTDEASYLKVHGEQSVESFQRWKNEGGDEAFSLGLTGGPSNRKARDVIRQNGNTINDPDLSRKARPQPIQYFTNEQILNASGQSELSLLKVEGLNRQEQDYPKHHFAGMVVTNTSGLRYVYGIPAYNRRQSDYLFSVKRPSQTDKGVAKIKTKPNFFGEGERISYGEGDKLYDQKDIPAYPHAYLLTAVVGPDYVDITGNGVSADDLGYWVKFTYQKEGDLYKWRSPYSGASHMEGMRIDNDDNKASFTYGEKEIWYLTRAETKSYVAEFKLSERKDGLGAWSYTQNQQTDPGHTHKRKSLKRLNEILLMTREESKKPKNQRFIQKKIGLNYGYGLCKGIPNRTTATAEEQASGQTGKLTLKKLWFEYGVGVEHSGGDEDKSYEDYPHYQFDYGTGMDNPDYNQFYNDRWGYYRDLGENPETVDYESAHRSPYVQQKPESEREEYDRWMASWSLRRVKLPTGSEIFVDYEGDDYSHVQHREAKQMFKMVNPDDPESKRMYVGEINPTTFEKLSPKVYFELEDKQEAEAIFGANDTEDKRKEALGEYLATHYLSGWETPDAGQLFFRIKTNLGDLSSDRNWDYVTGYADLDIYADSERKVLNYDKVGIERRGEEGNYRYYGFLTLNTKRGYHPFSMFSWQHLRANYPKRLDPVGMSAEDPGVSDFLKVITIIPMLSYLFSDYWRLPKERGWGRHIDLNESVIRLKSPDGIKHGGGLRVKQLTMRDIWDGDGRSEASYYGQYYDYRIPNDRGEMVSSGVASYEPMVGGDENALRYAKKYKQSVALQTDNNLFFEYPVNESYYPGPEVGYRRVRVSSLSSTDLAWKYRKRVEGENTPYPLKYVQEYFEGADERGSTGMQEYEFYTAKEFPVLASETSIDMRSPYSLFIPIPFVGQVTIDRMAASQGYSVVLNDMHGKTRRTAEYRQRANGDFENKPYKEISYHYYSEPHYYQGKEVRKLRNDRFRVSKDQRMLLPFEKESEGTVPDSERRIMAQSSELFSDARYSVQRNFEGGVNLNVDFVTIIVFGVPIVIPIYTVWPNGSSSEKELKTIVTNKIIHRRGILKEVRGKVDGATTHSENLAWDALTGKVLLSSERNDFGAPVYSYSVPAYYKYKGMGPAYQNIGYAFRATIQKVDQETSSKEYLLYPTDFRAVNHESPLVEGDELMVYALDEEQKRKEAVGVARIVSTGRGSIAIYMSGAPKLSEKEKNEDIPYQDRKDIPILYAFEVVRSGYSNLLEAETANVVSLSNPLEDNGLSPRKTPFKVKRFNQYTP